MCFQDGPLEFIVSVRARVFFILSAATGLGFLVRAGMQLEPTVARSVCYGLAGLVLMVFTLSNRFYRLYLQKVEKEKQQVEEMAALHLRTIEALALAIDAKHQTTREHFNRMSAYSAAIGIELGLGKNELDALQAAALLHDVGHLAVPEHIMTKPGKLTAEEFEKIKIHPVVGAEILGQVGFPYPVVPIVRAHHERWDGTGYPDGLKGEEIPIGARILYAVDALQAIASDRPYQQALPLEQAVEYLIRNAGKEFDPCVVDIIRKRYRDLEKLAQSRSQVESEVQVSPTTGRTPGDTKGDSLAPVPKPQTEGDLGFIASIASARQEAQMLWQLTHDLGSSLRLDETLPLFSARLCNLVPFDALVIYVRQGNKLVSGHIDGENFRVSSCLEIPVGEGVSGWVAMSGKPIINGNPALETGYTANSASAAQLRSALAVPLDSPNGPVGVLTLYQAEAGAFTQENLRVLLAISSKLGLCIENSLQFQQAESSATTDYLTELPNARSLFLHLAREIARCHRTKSPLGVMVCDLNGFKQVNDRFGHLEGNRILKEFAGVLREICREYDYVARMGGDEFVIVAPGMRREAAHERALLLNRYVQEIGERVCGERLLSISVGSSFYLDDGIDAEQLLREADRRMYSLKQIHHAKEISEAQAN